MASQEVTPAERIRELSAINADIPAMLEAAGKAISAITNNPLTKPGSSDEMDVENGDNNVSIEQHKAAFAEHTKRYYTTLQAIVARLRRQAYALEEAGIIDAEASSKASSFHKESERITNGGLGNLDVGWLNSRGNKVGAEKENELVEEARKLVEETLSREQNGKDGTIT
jgi:hypothetical protein